MQCKPEKLKAYIDIAYEDMTEFWNSETIKEILRRIIESEASSRFGMNYKYNKDFEYTKTLYEDTLPSGEKFKYYRIETEVIVEV